MPKVPVYLPIKEVKIQIYLEDKVSNGGNSFSRVQELAEFLKDNPELAKAVGYVPKSQKK